VQRPRHVHRFPDRAQAVPVEARRSRVPAVDVADRDGKAGCPRPLGRTTPPPGIRENAGLGRRGDILFALDPPERAASTPIYALEMEGGLLDSEGRFEEYVQDALDSLPSDLRARMSNVEILVEGTASGPAAAWPLSGCVAHQTSQSPTAGRCRTRSRSTAARSPVSTGTTGRRFAGRSDGLSYIRSPTTSGSATDA
jgi:hypothetical protein